MIKILFGKIYRMMKAMIYGTLRDKKKIKKNALQHLPLKLLARQK